MHLKNNIHTSGSSVRSLVIVNAVSVIDSLFQFMMLQPRTIILNCLTATVKMDTLRIVS